MTHHWPFKIISTSFVFIQLSRNGSHGSPFQVPSNVIPISIPNLLHRDFASVGNAEDLPNGYEIHLTLLPMISDRKSQFFLTSLYNCIIDNLENGMCVCP